MMGMRSPGAGKSDSLKQFGRDVAKVIREARNGVAGKEIADRAEGKTPAAGSIDAHVKEQVLGEFDKLIEKHDPAPPARS